MMFSLVASGSRTAMVALLLMAMFAFTSDRSIIKAIQARTKAHIAALVGLIAAASVAAFTVNAISVAYGIESFRRGTDPHTLLLRAKSFIGFVAASDWTLIAPDIQGVREVFVQDNAYLSLINSHGVIVAGLLCWLLATIPRQVIESNPEDLLAYRHLSIFFIISGMSNSFLNSFPNNQLFFIAVGAWLCVAIRPDTARAGSSPQVQCST